MPQDARYGPYGCREPPEALRYPLRYSNNEPFNPYDPHAAVLARNKKRFEQEHPGQRFQQEQFASYYTSRGQRLPAHMLENFAKGRQQRAEDKKAGKTKSALMFSTK